MVSCGACQHYIPDPAGFNGIGQCELYNEHLKKYPNAPPVKGRTLYPNALRECDKFTQI